MSDLPERDVILKLLDGVLIERVEIQHHVEETADETGLVTLAPTKRSTLTVRFSRGEQ